MGNASSRHPGEEFDSDEVIANLPPSAQKKLNNAYPNFFEVASLATDPVKAPQKQRNPSVSHSVHSNKSGQEKQKGGRKSSSSSSTEGSSHISSVLTPLDTPSSLTESRAGGILANCTSKIDFETIHGRRYQISPGTHFYLPCDDDEADRLVIMHFLLKYAFNGNVVAPVIQNLRVKLEENKEYTPKVLDVGCGPGSWVLEMATEFPNSEFHGIDLRTMFPSTIKPKNTKFLQHDFLQNLPYPDETFEFVRMRSMLGFITQTQLLHLLSEMHRVLKPMGYIELLDVEYQIHRPGPICDIILNQQLREIMQKKEIDFLASHHLSTLLMTQPAEGGGFIDVHQHRVTIPIGWGGQLGEVHAQNLMSFLKSIHPNIKRNIAFDNYNKTIDVDLLISKAIKECTTMQSHMNWFVCYGQKPANNVFRKSTTSSAKSSNKKIPNDIVTDYPSLDMITPPNLSPNPSLTDIKAYYSHHEYEINDFVDGYID